MVDQPTAYSCRVFLVRHGETVDNVKGLYAGIRDSPLTSHGVLQASKLGQYFAKQAITLTHIFTSDLTRAVKTSERIQEEQQDPEKAEVTHIQNLREQNFGYLEGRSWQSKESPLSSEGHDQHKRPDTPSNDRQDVESKDSMKRRAQEFLDQHLFPLLVRPDKDEPLVVAIISHGMLLATLWRCILSSQPPDSVKLAPEVNAPLSLEHLGGWSNTGYLEITLSAAATLHTETKPHSGGTVLPKRQLTVLAVNKRVHLTGLKRTRGGVGSSQHDEKQKSIDSFFKKPRGR